MNIEKFKSVLSVQSDYKNQFRMFTKIVRELKKIDGVSLHLDNGNLYATKGIAKVYPCIVSHIDTVHNIVRDLFPLEINGRITGFDRTTMTQTGIGGDDKVGIYIALECMETLDYCKAVFFRDEETGCNGSYEADLNFFDDCSFVLQCDRRGSKDFVIDACGTELSGKAFQKAIKKTLKSFGYDFSDGGMTDVQALKEIGLNVCCANMSCGYYNPHEDNEFVNIEHVSNCLDMVIALFNRFGDEVFEHKQKPYSRLKYTPPKKSGFKFDFFEKDHHTGAKKSLLDLWDEEDSGEVCPGCRSVLNDPNCTDQYCDTCGMYVSEINDYINATSNY